MTNMKERFAQMAEQAKKASSSLGEKMADVRRVATETAKSVAVTALDQNGDGKVDQADVKIMTEKGIDLAKRTGDELKELAKDASKSELARDASAGAMVGALIAVPVPVIGPIAGAAIGATFGVYTNIVKGGVTVIKTEGEGRRAAKTKKIAAAPKKTAAAPKKKATVSKKAATALKKPATVPKGKKKTE